MCGVFSGGQVRPPERGTFSTDVREVRSQCLHVERRARTKVLMQERAEGFKAQRERTCGPGRVGEVPQPACRWTPGWPVQGTLLL